MHAGLRETFRAAGALITPRERLEFTEWVEAERILPAGTSSRPGPFRVGWCAAAPEIYRTLDNVDVREVVVLGPTQLLKTELILNYLFYIIDTDPAPTKYILPTEPLTREFVETRVEKGVADMAARIRETLAPSVRRKGNTTYFKTFDGGFVSFNFSGQKAGLISTPTKYVLVDELDKMETDIMGRLNSRQTTFADSKRLIVSSPGMMGECRITAAWEQGHRAEWNFRCENCSELFVPKIELVEWPRPNKFEDARLHCPHCRAAHDDLMKVAACRAGRYVADRPLGRVASFRMNAFAHPDLTLAQLAREYAEARAVLKTSGEDDRIRDFMNERMAEAYDNEERPINIAAARAKLATLQTKKGVVDSRVCFISVVADVQGDRIEAEAVGWFATRKKGDTAARVHSQGIERLIIPGDIADPTSDCIPRLIKFFRRRYWSGGIGKELKIDLQASHLLIDSGYKGDTVRNIVRQGLRNNLKIFPIRGHVPSPANRTDEGRLYSYSQNQAVVKSYGRPLLMVDSNRVKDLVFSRIRQSVRAKGEETPLVQMQSGGRRGYGDGYWLGLDAERRKLKKKSGQWVVEYEREAHLPNEALDLLCYGHVALDFCGGVVMLEEQGKRLAAGRRRAIKRTGIFER